jgi:predicted transcriptional regulator
MARTIPITLTLPSDLKQRLMILAEQSGESPHNLILEAIRRHIDYEERMRAIAAEALEADRDIERTSEVYAAAEVHASLEGLAEGNEPLLPTARRR